jgi:hypothetical protein
VKNFTLGLFFFFCSLSLNAENILSFRGFVPHVQSLSFQRSKTGFNLQFKQNSHLSGAKLSLLIKRKGQKVENNKISSNYYFRYFSNNEKHPIRSVTLIQH